MQKRCHWRVHDYISYNRSLSKSIQVEGKRVTLSHPQRGRVNNYVCPRAGQANIDVTRENGGQSSSCSLRARPIEVEQCNVSISIQKRYRYRRAGPANPHDGNILSCHGDPARLKSDREAFPVEQIAFPPARDRPQSVGRAADAAAGLCGTVTTSPSKLRTYRSVASTEVKSPAPTCIGIITASMLRPQKRSLNRLGDLTCATGSPNIAKRRVMTALHGCYE